MELTVRLFAGLKARYGACVLLELPDSASVASVRAALEEKGIWTPGSRIAVNQTFANLDDTVDRSDEVAVIPPVSGG